MNRHLPLALLVILLVASCATTSEREGVRQFAGIYQQGFEVEIFRPCGSPYAWWVVRGDELNARYRRVTQAPYDKVFVIVRGQVTERGSWGHLGKYIRQIAVDEVIRVDPKKRGRC